MLDFIFMIGGAIMDIVIYKKTKNKKLKNILEYSGIVTLVIFLILILVVIVYDLNK